MIQKHEASRLHYDFWLVLNGVLRSGAVPNKPRTDVGRRGLAIPVEDHPLDYRCFEATIPKGQYGGGTVIVWDEGQYRYIGSEQLPQAACARAWPKARYRYYWKKRGCAVCGHAFRGHGKLRNQPGC